MLDTKTPPAVVALRRGGPDAKPLLRGVAHKVAALMSPALALLLVARANGTRALVGATVYGAALVALFGVSGLYHSQRLSPRVREWLGRIDHANIFVFIAGSSLPVSILAVGGRQGEWIAATVATGALLGVLQTLWWPSAPRTLHVALYVIISLPGLYGFAAMREHMGDGFLALQAAGGLLYVAGAVIYARRRPDPLPAVFGYHEVFHALVIAATGCFYTAIYQCVVRG